jgi:mannitol/fructose-specific phosphotransferase system IIA component (Ntr-type)
LITVFLVLAFAGKVIGCGLGAYWGGINKNNSLAIGFGMNSRGAMEIILGIIALRYNLIQEKVFVALVIMALVTSITSAPLMSYFLKRSKKVSAFVDLLKPENIFFSDATDKKDIISELCFKISSCHKLSNEKIIKEVFAREKLLSTGLEKHLAIPHAKVNVPEPIVAVAVHKEGIDFDSHDGLPAKIIILLITPQNDSEIQLKLLAEISGKIGKEEVVNMLVESKNPTEFILNIKQLY